MLVGQVAVAGRNAHDKIGLRRFYLPIQLAGRSTAAPRKHDLPHNGLNDRAIELWSSAHKGEREALASRLHSISLCILVFWLYFLDGLRHH
jgi:hypothetical protein